MKRIITLSICLISIQILSQTKLKKTKNKIDTIQKLDEVIINSNLIFGNKYVASNRTESFLFFEFIRSYFAVSVIPTISLEYDSPFTRIYFYSSFSN